MQTAPKSLRTHILFAGRVNSGKSTLVNLLAGQNVAITSQERGTTTDVVEKSMELRPAGPVVLLDSAGTDDDSTLGVLRVERTYKALKRADALVIVTTPGVWGEPEAELLSAATEDKIPVIMVVNKSDTAPEEEVFSALPESKSPPIAVSAVDTSVANRDRFVEQFTAALLTVLPEEHFAAQVLLQDLVPENGHVLMMVPIDSQAPKGRLILPQVQAIRDALDGNAICTVAKESAFPEI